MPTTATLIGYIASGLVLLDWLPPVLSLNLLLLPLNPPDADEQACAGYRSPEEEKCHEMLKSSLQWRDWA